jgi:putative phosphoesterase
MLRALDIHKDAEAVFFLGDGLTDIISLVDREPRRAWFYVRGNCDYTSAVGTTPVRKLESVTLEGYRIVFTHGDLYGAKYGLGGLILLAGEQAASVVLFGHTHTPCETYENGVYLFNPGSISSGSFGVMTITASGILLSHGKL